MRRITSSIIAVATAATFALGGSAAPAEAVASITGLSIQGDRNTRAWRSPATTFDAPSDQDGTDTVSALRVSQGASYPFDMIWISAPSGEALDVGTYSGATGMGGAVPRLMLNETGCNLDIVGSFEILELVHSGDMVTRLAFRFEWSCGGPVRSGEYRYNSTLDLRAPDLAPLASDTTAIYFGKVTGGTASPTQTVTLTNRGTTDIALTGTALTGQAPTAFEITADTCSDSTVAAGASCTVDVRATPPAAGGDLNANLTFAGNTYRPTFGASLSVRGLVATALEILTPSTVQAFGGIAFTARLSPVTPSTQQGSIGWFLDGEQLGVSSPIDGNGESVRAGLIGFGPHELKAVYWPAEFVSPLAAPVEVTKTITGVNWVNLELTSDWPTSVAQNTAQTFTATMTTGSAPASGTLTIRNATTDQVLASKAVTGTSTTLTTPSMTLPVGDTEIVAAFTGDPTFQQATASRTQTVVADTGVEATGQTASPSPFYPVVDGYRDNLAIRGTAVEPVTVTIRIYNSSKSLVRSLPLGSRSGAYSTTWNGRTSGGTLVASGTYTVRHHLVDASGNVKDVDVSVTLSQRKVKWVTTSITRYGSAYAASTKGGTGSISARSSFTKGVKIAGGSSASGYAVVRWSYTLRSALAYKGLKIAVLGKGTRSASRAILAFGQDSAGTLVGPTYRWYSRSGSVTGRVNNRVVLLDVEADGPMSGAFDIAKTMVTYTYAVWP